MCSVLVVEDEPWLRKALVTALRNDGYDVAGVGTAQEAIDTVTRVTIDLLLLDLGLPDMDGVAALKQLRESASIDIAVVVLTGRSDRKAEVQAVVPEAIYVVKPALNSAILLAVRDASKMRVNRLMTRIGSDPEMPSIRKMLDETVRAFRATQRKQAGHGGAGG